MRHGERVTMLGRYTATSLTCAIQTLHLDLCFHLLAYVDRDHLDVIEWLVRFVYPCIFDVMNHVETRNGAAEYAKRIKGLSELSRLESCPESSRMLVVQMLGRRCGDKELRAVGVRACKRTTVSGAPMPLSPLSLACIGHADDVRPAEANGLTQSGWQRQASRQRTGHAAG